ncbi:hypothetical protein ONZ43_g2596 [Nemania bipapillata]|uniref:Uncharacterized protein n=1 Tax=Nemania bipapillata TaxID=110536 RepID=A0ACC2J050_9PEZI|nr:hypothetical protein ONZ43_g2596 [Nemania bipapillata]
MASQERITVHNLADLKNTSDDAIPNYLNSLKFKQDHRLVDTRLALGYGAFAIAAACFLWDYKLGFESTKWFTAAAVALYSIINGALTIWITFVEKGIVYQGTAPDGTKVRQQRPLSTIHHPPAQFFPFPFDPTPLSPSLPSLHIRLANEYD